MKSGQNVLTHDLSPPTGYLTSEGQPGPPPEKRRERGEGECWTHEDNERKERGDGGNGMRVPCAEPAPDLLLLLLLLLLTI